MLFLSFTWCVHVRGMEERGANVGRASGPHLFRALEGALGFRLELGRHLLALLHELPLLVSQVIGSEHGGRPLLDLLHLSAGRVRVLVQVNGRPSPLALTPRRTTAGGAASARGGAMSKLPELSASARAAAAAPLATDRLGPAMLMTGAFVSDATRGAPGRRVRRMRCAKSCGAGC